MNGQGCVIDINGGARRLEVAGGKSLLATLEAEGILLPSACGGRGICGYCRVRVVAGGGTPTAAERRLLGGEELADGVRLACQVKVTGDLAIVVPAELFRADRYRGVVEAITDLTYDIKQLGIGLIAPKVMRFRPGQYIQLRVPGRAAEGGPLYRAFSISSPPEEASRIELIVRLVPGGQCTSWIFSRLKVCDEVVFNGPHGHFTLSDSDREMVWVAGGSGMAPFWSMLRHGARKGLERKCTYFFGAVGRRDLFLLDELIAMERELEGFTFVPALSDPAPGDEWTGQRGLITEVLDRHIADGAEMEAYLCGSPGMIAAARKVLRAKGMPDERTFFDEFA